jgi:hypothetical protein
MPPVVTGSQSRKRCAHSKSRGGCLGCKRRHSKVRMKHTRTGMEAVMISVLTIQQPYSATRFVRRVVLVGAWAMIVTTSQSNRSHAPTPEHKDSLYRDRHLIRIHLYQSLLPRMGLLLQRHQLLPGMRRRRPRGLVTPQQRPLRVSPYSR